jgi:uncharacterized membrane protein YgdD (TMEM256/DUF423 family)
MNRYALTAGALMCAIAVAFGAFGAHAIADTVSPARLETWQTASRYLMFHGLALLIITSLAINLTVSFKPAVMLIFSGAIIFSTALYLLVLLNLSWLGAIAPIGGVLMISGWITAAVILFKRS